MHRRCTWRWSYATEGQAPTLYLYDVTRSDLEGVQNELGEYGYNRDVKRGRQQIVIGLLTDEEGGPITVGVLAGNTQDPKTFTHHIDKRIHRFGVKQVTCVGDRGMIKTTQIGDLEDAGFHMTFSLGSGVGWRKTAVSAGEQANRQYRHSSRPKRPRSWRTRKDPFEAV